MKLVVVMLNTWITQCAILHENEHRPYGRRLVTLELTPQQVSALRPMQVGMDRGQNVTESIGEVWIEL